MKKMIFISLFTTFSAFAIAQESNLSKFNNLYFFAEVGKASGYDYAIYGGAVVQFDQHYFKIKTGIVTDRTSKEQRQLIKAYYGDDHKEVPTRSVDSYSLMYGRNYRLFKIGQIQFGSGLAYVEKSDPDVVFNEAKRDVEPEKYIKRRTVGLPAEIKYAIQIKRYLGINCTYNANLNPIKSFSGFSFGLAVGLY